jgi:hypothetical protein
MPARRPPPSRPPGTLFDSIDRASFPRVAEYLARLPDGVGSYPDCYAKGSIFRRLLESRPVRGVRSGALPEQIREVLSSPPLDGDWIPEAHLGCVCLAIADFHAMTDDDYLAWVGPVNKKLFKGFHGFVMSLISVETAVRRGGGYWKMFHRGTQVTAEQLDERLWAVRMEFPPSLFAGLFLAQYAPVFRAGLEMANPDVDVQFAEGGERFGIFQVRWPR